MQYKQVKKFMSNEVDTNMIVAIDESGAVWYIPNNPELGMWQEYQAWLAADENNQPDPAD